MKGMIKRPHVKGHEEECLALASDVVCNFLGVVTSHGKICYTTWSIFPLRFLPIEKTSRYEFRGPGRNA